MHDAGHWPLKRLGEVVEVLDHLRVPVNSDERAKRPGDVPYYGANGQQGWIDKALFDEPLVLLAEDGGHFDEFNTRPIAYRIDGPSWVNNHAHIIRIISGASQDFVFWSLVHRDIRKYIAGGTRDKLTQGELRAIEIPLPPLPEQRLIAEILDTLDEAIRKTEQLIAKLKQVKQGLLHDLLMRGIDENGELRDPELHPEQFKDSPLGRIPRGWKISPLRTLSDLQVGYAFKSEWFSDHEGVLLLRGENVGYGVPNWSVTKRLPQRYAQRFNDYLLKAGDVIIGMDRTFTRQGVKVTVLGKDDAPSLLVQRVGKFLLHGATNEYVRQLLLWPGYHRELLAQEKGMDIPHLSKTEILSPLVPIPPTDEQVQISIVLSNLEERSSGEEQSLIKLRLIKQGLMEDLLTGRVRVTALLGEHEREATPA